MKILRNIIGAFVLTIMLTLVISPSIAEAKPGTPEDSLPTVNGWGGPGGFIATPSATDVGEWGGPGYTEPTKDKGNMGMKQKVNAMRYEISV